MKIGIHHREGSFSHVWIEYCKKKGINYKLVNCYHTDIIKHLNDCDVLMWHHLHTSYKDKLAAKNILFALEHAGVKVFPDFNTNWHFDDKIAQMYLLQAIKAPVVPSYIFYERESVLKWVKQTDYPKVFKLKGGSGSSNVRLVNTKIEAEKIIKISFGKGFSQFNRFSNLKELYRKYGQGKTSLLNVFNGVRRVFLPTSFSKMTDNEKGYVYFQDFIPHNKTDFRVKIVANRCWAFQRAIRKNDFRASGSGEILYDKDVIPKKMLEISFDVYKRLNLQSVAFDFVLKNNEPLIVEMSYGFGIDEEELEIGYWDKDYNWIPGKFNPHSWMVDEVISDLNNNIDV